MISEMSNVGSVEEIALKWGDVDWNGRFVLVQRNSVRGLLTSPKSHRRRGVDLSSQLLATLLAWKRAQQARWMAKGKNLPLWVFPSSTGTAIEERNLGHIFKRMLEKAGSVRFAFTTCDTRSRRCCCNKVNQSST